MQCLPVNTKELWCGHFTGNLNNAGDLIIDFETRFPNVYGLIRRSLVGNWVVELHDPIRNQIINLAPGQYVVLNAADEFETMSDTYFHANFKVA